MTFSKPQIFRCFVLTILQIIWLAGLLSANNSRIIGRVVDKEEQAPLTHVQVYIENLQRGDVTDEDGRFEIDKLPPGKYDLIFQIQGYKPSYHNDIQVVADRTVEVTVELESTVIEFDELLITANRRANLEHEVSQQVSVVSAKEIQDRNVHQTAEVLREEAGIIIQKTNQGGGSPIIRGLKANKVLLMVDGIRMNNATYRGGNLQYLNTVDSGALEQMEVVHGPNSVMYGSDALGGVINIITQKPTLSHSAGHRFAGSGSVTLSSADESQTVNLGLGISNSAWGLDLNFAYKSFGNIRRGSNGGETLMRRLENDSRADRILNRTQSPNDYRTFDASASFLVRPSEFHALSAAVQFNRQQEVPRYDVFEAQTDSIFLFDPQERDLAYVRYRHTQGNNFYSSATVTVSLQRQAERRIRQKFGSLTQTSDQFRTITAGFQLQFSKLLNEHHLVYGTEFYSDQVATKSLSSDLSTGEFNDRDPLFPDGSSFLNFGLFIQDEWNLFPSWKLDFGARFSAFRSRAPFDENSAAGQFDTVVQSPTSVTGSVGSRLKVSDDVNFITNISQGFRTPNLDDVSKLGPGKGSSFFDIPNPDVGPEKTLSFDGGFKIHSQRIRATVVGYYTYITDLLLRRPAEFNGTSFVVDGGDTLAVFRKENAGRAYTAGFELSGDLLLTSQSAVFGRLSYTRGQNLSDDEPLSSIPPFNALVGWRSNIKNYQFEINARFAAKQDRLSLEDQEDLRIPEGGTPGWYTVNIRLRSTITRSVTLNLGVSNLFDQNYREHLSGFNAPGRNFIFGLRGSF
ncbi:TonB-dependent receptor [bacterium]|nr:TonB-dependent receptor [bacterium]